MRSGQQTSVVEACSTRWTHSTENTVVDVIIGLLGMLCGVSDCCCKWYRRSTADHVKAGTTAMTQHRGRYTKKYPLSNRAQQRHTWLDGPSHAPVDGPRFPSHKKAHQAHPHPQKGPARAGQQAFAELREVNDGQQLWWIGRTWIDLRKGGGAADGSSKDEER